jgi:hypothetical protein
MTKMPSSSKADSVAGIPAGGKNDFLCLTICGYKKAGMSDEAYRQHMTQVSAPMTKDLMVKYGIVRWTQVNNMKGPLQFYNSFRYYLQVVLL